MKINMKRAYILLIFPILINCEYYLNIGYNKEYKVNVSFFPEGYLPRYTNFYFRVPVESNNDFELRLKVYNNSIINFKVDLCGFEYYPSDYEMKIGHSKCLINQKYSNTSTVGNFTNYKYSFNTLENVNYLSIHTENYYDLYFLSVTVNSKSRYYYYNISYTKEFELNSSTLMDNYGKFLFQLKNENEKNETIKLKIKKMNELNNNINISLYELKQQLNDTQKFADYSLSQNKLQLKSLINDDNYTTYEYPFEKINNTEYLGFAVEIDKNIDYLSFYVGKQKSEESQKPENSQDLNESSSPSILLIIFLIILYTIIVVVIVYFVLKKLGYSKSEDINSKDINKKFEIEPES